MVEAANRKSAEGIKDWGGEEKRERGGEGVHAVRSVLTERAIE